jgi:hypothetical protein
MLTSSYLFSALLTASHLFSSFWAPQIQVLFAATEIAAPAPEGARSQSKKEQHNHRNPDAAIPLGFTLPS